MIQTGSRVGAHFWVERLAGSGGMGEVYRAVDESTGLPVAIKVLLDGGHGDTSRFLREARLLSSLDHPGIVRHVAHGSLDSGHPFLVMEWLEGEDLAACIERGPLHASDAVALMMRVADALGALHERGIVHRDLKPSNIFLPGGRLEEAKLLDFGIASSQTLTRITRTGTLLGTAAYIAPEQANGGPLLDARSDVFSLGCVLYECLSGQKAFQGDSWIAILTKILLGQLGSLREARPGLPESLYGLVERMLAHSPADRPSNGRAVGEALRAMGDLQVLGLADTVEIPRLPSLTHEEQRATALVIVGPPLAADPAEYERLEAEALAHGARFERIVDGSFLAILTDTSVATDLATKAALCALALRRIAKDRRISLSVGFRESTGQRQLGAAIDRATRGVVQEPEENTGNHVVLDEFAVGLLEGRFQVGKLGRTFVLQDERDASDARTLLGMATPFVGRERDMRQIERSFEECVTNERAMVVVVSAAAGMGKSRLCRQVMHNLRARRDPHAIWLARGRMLGAGSALGMLSELLYDACGLRSGESAESCREKLVLAVNKRVSEAHRTRVAAFLGEVMGARFSDEGNPQLLSARRDPQLMGDMIRDAFVDFVQGECKKNPLVIILEDLHWGDESTVKILDVVLRDGAETPLFIMAFARPEVDELFPKLWKDRNPEVIRLRELGKKASEQLVAHVLGADVDRDVLDRIVKLADGNAFYLEELIRKVAEGRGTDLPETVVAMVQSRIAGLDDVFRRILRAASIFGEVFWLHGVSALLGGSFDVGATAAGIQKLCDGEFVTKQRTSRFVEQTEYAFRHALVREGAYALLTDEDRILGHRLVAHWLEQQGENNALTLADHFEKGGDNAHAGPLFVQAAIQCVERFDSTAIAKIAARALRAGVTGEMLGILRSVEAETGYYDARVQDSLVAGLEALPLLRPGSFRWCRAARSIISTSSQIGRMDVFGQVLGQFLAVEPEDENAQFSWIACATSLVMMFSLIGMRDQAEAILAQAEQRQPKRKDPLASGNIALARHVVLSYHGDDVGGSFMWAQQSFESCDVVGAREAIFAESMMVTTLSAMGGMDDAMQMARRGLIRAQLLAEPMLVFAMALGLALSLLDTLDPVHLSEAETIARLARDVAKGNLMMAGRASEALARTALLTGRMDEAETYVCQSMEMLSTLPAVKPQALTTYARILLLTGRHEQARGCIDELQGLLSGVGGGGYFGVHGKCVMAEVREAVGDKEGAINTLREAVAQIRRRAASIRDDEMRHRYLTQSAECRRTRLVVQRIGAEPASDFEWGDVDKR